MKIDWQNVEPFQIKEFTRRGEMEKHPSRWKCCHWCRDTYDIMINISFPEHEWEEMYSVLGNHRLGKKANELQHDSTNFLLYVNDCMLLFDSNEGKRAFLYASELQHDKYSGSITVERRIYTKKNADGIKAMIHELEKKSLILNESRTNQIITEAFDSFDKDGWNYAFNNESDYKLFTDLLTCFFEYKPYNLPEKVIPLKRACKTKVAKVLGEIHKELSNQSNLSNDKDFFTLLRVLSHFEKEPEGSLYKALTR
jgi:hypothetical protein